MHWGFSDLLFWESTNVYLFSVLRNESVFEKNIIVFYSSILTAFIGEYIVNSGLKNSNYKEFAELREINEGTGLWLVKAEEIVSLY